jgi:23S rRNA (cytosine1962-C5)-methyltransferase
MAYVQPPKKTPLLTRTKFEYELVDCGNRQKIEKFGKVMMSRPCPVATWPPKKQHTSKTVTFIKNIKTTAWEGQSDLPETWNIQIGHITAELKFSSNGQVGLFPEQFDNWQYIQSKVAENSRRKLKILNGFGYTGMATLFASTKNTEVVHVDGAKSAINWAKRNAKLSGLENNKIRWICDDVLDFMEREVRRGNKYDGIILDPPAFGRGAKKHWKIERDLPVLIEAMGKLLVQHPLFVILTCHASDHFSAQDLADMLQSLPPFRHKEAEKLQLSINSRKGNNLPASFGVRVANE